MLNRCVPTPNITELLPSQIDKIVNISSIFTSDDVRLATLTLYKQLPDIGLLALIALALTIVLVTLLRYLAKLMVLLIIFLSCFGMIGSDYISYFIPRLYAYLIYLHLSAHYLPVASVQHLRQGQSGYTAYCAYI